MGQDHKKRRVAEAALDYIEDDCIIGVGSGTTMAFFIAALATVRHRIAGAVASSAATAAQLKQHGILVVPLNSAGDIPIYIDSADEANRHRCLIKGGGGALTQEKVAAAASERFICIIDDSKYTDLLGRFPLPVEIIPMAQGYVGRELAKLGGQPVLRQGHMTENGNLIIDVRNLKIMQPNELEQKINNIAGVVSNGIFARRPADVLLIADKGGVRTV